VARWGERSLSIHRASARVECQIAINDALRAKLDGEKAVAQLAAKGKTVRCPEWLGAQVLPCSTRGGYGHLLETVDFTVKVLDNGIPLRSGPYAAAESALWAGAHTHVRGVHGY
jgi:hypothetical protein